jgi:magnesium chelatase subunit D
MTADPAKTALMLLAVAPQDLGGVVLRGRAGAQRDAWLSGLKALLPAATPWRRMPGHITDDALLGGLDLTATLAQGRCVMRPGLLAQAAGGVVVAAMAERMSPALASRVTAALDDRASWALVALDEGIEEESAPASVYDRLAFIVQTDVPGEPGLEITGGDAAAIEQARLSWREVELDDAWLDALVLAADRLGIVSIRSICHAVTAARMAAALAGRRSVTQDDAALAARLVLAPRALQLPAPEQADEAPPESASAEPPPSQEADASSAPPAEPKQDTDPQQESTSQALAEQITEAAAAAIPPGLLAALTARGSDQARRSHAGRAGQSHRSLQRGRPIGSQRGQPRGGARLALIDTLRAAAPWQAVRRKTWAAAASRPEGSSGELARLLVSPEDLRVQRRVQQRATTTIFAIDASGSSAMHRLAEAKGAVELLLADCYARRDRVAVIGFRGAGAQILLAPTRSLVRAKRQLAGLAGGGGTPLASALDAVTALAASVRRGGATPLVVLLTDGSANIARGGIPGRPQATADALSAAKTFGASNTSALLIDTSPRPSPQAQQLAQAMRAQCVALPHAEAGALSGAVRRAQGQLVHHRD